MYSSTVIIHISLSRFSYSCPAGASYSVAIAVALIGRYLTSAPNTKSVPQMLYLSL